VDTEMDRLHLHIDTPCAKSASKKSVFGSLERSMDKLLCMLTPKKKRSTPSFDEPRSVKVWASLLLLCTVLLQLCSLDSNFTYLSLLFTCFYTYFIVNSVISVNY